MLAGLKKKWMCLKFSKEEVCILDLKNENLDDIPSVVFMHERTLDTLCLNSNHIKALPRELFLCMRLRKLLISDNDLIFIPPLIKTLPMLTHLDLSKNYITEIPECVKYCPNLSVLNLSANPLERIPEDLSLMMSLTELYLNNTMLERLPIVTGLFNLRVLELRDNKLQSLPRSFSGLISLQKLDLGINKFISWPAALQSLTELEEVLMNNNKIKIVPKDIGKLTNLSFLDLSENVISSIHEDIGLCTSMNDLYLNNNQISELPSSICNLKKLKKMRLDNNCLVRLPSSLGNFHQLYELNLSSNNLESLPTSISSLKSLRVIWLDDNFITSLPNELCMCSSLRLLSMRSNNLEELPESLGKLSHLIILNIVDNKISYLPNSIHMLKELKAIWITENQVKVKMHFYPTTTSTGLKVTTCALLPQQQCQIGDNEVKSKRRQSDKFVSFDGSALQVHTQRISPSYPKEMKAVAKSPRKVVPEKSKPILETAEEEHLSSSEEPLGNGVHPRKKAGQSMHSLNAHGDQDIRKEGKCCGRSLSSADLKESKPTSLPKGFQRPSTDAEFQMEEEIDVDKPLSTETSSGDDSVVSMMSYREFLRSLSQHDIHLPRKKKKRHNSSTHCLRKQHTFENIHHHFPGHMDSADRDIFKEMNLRVAPGIYFDDGCIHNQRPRTQNSFHR